MKILNTLTIALLLCLSYPLSLLADDGFLRKDLYKVKKVVIDAGHGGKDYGCHGSHSHEKHIALAIALKLGKALKKQVPDIEVIYTRDSDVFVTLNERAAIANKHKADLFISIHCNSAENLSAKGTETFVMGLHKTNSNLAVAKRENQVILLEDDYTAAYDGFDPNSPEAHIVFSLYQNAYLAQSIFFASLVEESFKKQAGRASRGVKQAGFLVLHKTAMPSVLVETGFLTHQTDENFLKTEKGQTIMTNAILDAFKTYKTQMERTQLPDQISSD